MGSRRPEELAARWAWRAEALLMDDGAMEHLAERLAAVPGVVAVTLGGSRATGTERADSDWDFGLYYQGTIDPHDVADLGFDGEVSAPGDWGRLVNGGAWLSIDGVAVDLIYRDLDEVRHWVAEADAGRFEVHREVGYAAGIATYVLAGELALGRVLVGSLPRPGFSDALRRTAPRWWFHIATMALRIADGAASRGEVVASAANLAVATLACAQGRLAERGKWALNEKGIVHRAGLAEAEAILGRVGDDPAALVASMAHLRHVLALGSPG